MTEEESPKEIKEQFAEQLRIAERLLNGQRSDIDISGSLNEAEHFTGLIVDPNDPLVTEAEVAYALDWIQKLLGGDINQVKRTQYHAEHTQMVIEKVNQPLGNDDDIWYLSVWQSPDAKPIYMLLPEEEFNVNLELGYEEVQSD